MASRDKIDNRVMIIADIIEGALSGQYGRDDAIALAEDCIDALDLEHPKKYEGGRCTDEKILWGYGFVYAENEETALAMVKERESFPDIAVVRLIR